MLVDFLTGITMCGGAPVVDMGFAGVAGSGGDGVLSGYCRGNGEDES